VATALLQPTLAAAGAGNHQEHSIMTTASATTTTASATTAPKTPKAAPATTTAFVPAPTASDLLFPTVTVGRIALKEALAQVGHAIAGKGTLPVLSTVQLRVAEGTLVLTATDLSLGIAVQIAATSRDTWDVCIPHKLFADIVGTLPGDTITIEQVRLDVIRLSCGGFETTLNGFEGSDFPILPAVTGTPVTLPGKAFIKAIESVAPCVATDHTRPILTGVWVRIANRAASFTAADGFRLAKVTIPLDAATNAIQFVTPGDALESIAALFTANDGPICMTVHPNGNTIAFAAGGITAITRIIEGKYPDADRIIPASSLVQTRATLNTAELANAFKLAGFFASSSSQISRAAIGTTTLTVTANAASVGDQRADVDATCAGQAVHVAFNVKFAAQITKVIDSATLTVTVTSPKSPIIFRPVGTDQAIFLLMPMTLQ